MTGQSDGGPRPSAQLRRWAIRIGVACLVLEVVYLIAGNLCIRMGVLERLINDRPEADLVSWDSARTLFPGRLSFTGFTYRGQSLDSQMSVHLERVDARIGIIDFLFFNTLHAKSVRAKDIDFRYRDRIDYPCWTEDSGEPFPGIPANIEHYPEITGYQNPPDPKPEDLYPREVKETPLTVRISGARIRGEHRMAYNEMRIVGNGTLRGGLTAVLGESYEINRGKIRLVPAAVVVGSRALTDDLDLRADVRVDPFPAECAEASDILAGFTGNLTIAGRDSDGFTMNVSALSRLMPGQGVLSIESGTGELSGRLEVDDDEVASGRFDLVSDDLVVKKREDPFYGDLEIHAQLSEGDLVAGRFDVSGTTVRLDDIVRMEESTKKQERLEPWFCDLEIEEGILTMGHPMAADSHVRVRMHDTRPVVALLRPFTTDLKSLARMRNVKNIDGTMDLDFGAGFLTVSDLALTGDNLEVLGWLDIRNQVKNGRLFVRHGVKAAGVAFNEGKGTVILIKPRMWFEKQQRPPSSRENAPVGEIG